jgi:Fe-S cluster assembly ATP-binding protein
MTNLLEIQELSVAVDGQELLQGLSLCIPAGEVHALLGPNGCGKTTLMMAIMGYPHYQVTGGAILYDGADITHWDITQRARAGISLAHQRPPTLAGVTLRNLVTYVMGDTPERTAQGEELAAAFHMGPFLDRSINAGLSGGEIKRSELVQMLAMHPRFALLDEPDSGIDLESLALVGQMVQAVVAPGPDHSQASAALLVTHTGYILDYVTVDKAHVMSGGRIQCCGEPASLIAEIRRRGFQACVSLCGQAERRPAPHASNIERVA